MKSDEHLTNRRYQPMLGKEVGKKFRMLNQFLTRLYCIIFQYFAVQYSSADYTIEFQEMDSSSVKFI